MKNALENVSQPAVDIQSVNAHARRATHLVEPIRKNLSKIPTMTNPHFRARLIGVFLSQLLIFRDFYSSPHKHTSDELEFISKMALNAEASARAIGSNMLANYMKAILIAAKQSNLARVDGLTLLVAAEVEITIEALQLLAEADLEQQA